MTFTPRPYQLDAIGAAREALRTERATLIVMATGLGKTVVFSEIARRATELGGRTLVLAHRGELLDQARKKLEALGVRVGLEKAQHRAEDEASVQTLRGSRLTNWPRQSFSLIVIDEAHHAAAKTYRDILDHFHRAKVLGVTATPDRLDGKGIGEVFDSCAYRYEMRRAIKDGWLCRLSAQRVHVDSLDLSKIRTVAGDLHQGELDAAMRACVDGVAEPLQRLAETRPTIVFAVTVAHAHALAAAINARRPGSARAVDGSAKAEERAQAVSEFQAGRYQFLVNCALYTEGFDAPETSCIAVARPTKSRALYTQMVGRGTRLAENKGDCLILDFAGLAGRHSLAGPVDVLAGDQDADIAAAAAELMEKQACDVEQAIAEAAQVVAEKRERAKQHQVFDWWATQVDPFVCVDSTLVPAWSGDESTDAQRRYLERVGLNAPAGLSKGQASNLIAAIQSRQERGLATFKQVRLLRRHGIDARDLTVAEASARIAVLSQRWRKLA